MKAVLEGVLQSSIVFSVCVILWILFLRKTRSKVKPTFILGIWCILCTRLYIIYPVIYGKKVINAVAELFNNVPESLTQAEAEGRTSLISLVVSPFAMQHVFAIWLIGAGIFLTIHFIRFRKVMKKLLTDSRHISDLFELAEKNGFIPKDRWKHCDVRQCKALNSPMLVGFFRKYLMLPDMEADVHDVRLLLAHEIEHYEGRDLFIQQAFLFANAVHWFNPLVYFSRRYVTEAIELSCDHKVVRGMSGDEREEYMELLCISLRGIGKKIPSEISLSLSKSVRLVKYRLESIEEAGNKRGGFGLIVMVIVMILLLQPFAYIDVFAEPFEGSYLRIQYEDENGLLQFETTPLKNLYYSKNGGEISSVSEQKNIELENGDAIRFYFSENTETLELKKNSCLRFVIKTSGNKELRISFGDKGREVHELSQGEVIFFNEDTEGVIEILNFTSEKTLLY